MEDNLINDGTYQCERCGETIKAFTSSGETNFCTNCGAPLNYE